jgi:hypothetical protein
VLLAAAGTASAQTSTSQCWGSGTEFTCQTTPNSPGGTPGQYGYLHDAGKQAFQSAGYGLGQILAGATAQRVHAVGIVLAIKCGHTSEFAMVSYSDGSTKKVEMNYEITQSDRANIAAVLPQVRLVDLVGCDE